MMLLLVTSEELGGVRAGGEMSIFSFIYMSFLLVIMSMYYVHFYKFNDIL